MQEFYDITVAGVKRSLPVVPINENMSIAGFVIFGDTDVVEPCARALAEKLPPETEVLVTAEAKSIPLIYEMAKVMKMPRYVIARKSVKGYMRNPIITTVNSITNMGKEQILVVDEHDAEFIKGKKVAIIDDVISTGSSIEAIEKLVKEAEAHAGATGIDHAGLGINGQALDGDHAGDKAGDERRALADGLGDVGGKHGNHEVHGDTADDLEHGGEAVVVGSRRIEGRDAPQERNGGQDTTGNDEDQHVADAVHEVLVDDVTDGLLLLDLILDIGSSRNRVVALGGECAVDQLAGSLDGQGLGNTNGNHGLAGETLRLDILVGCDDNGLGASDLALGELVLDTDLAMGLDLNGQPALGSSLLQRLLRHEGVRDAGRATGGGDDVKLSHVSLLLEYCARGRSPTRASMRVFPHLKDTNPPLI